MVIYHSIIFQFFMEYPILLSTQPSMGLSKHYNTWYCCYILYLQKLQNKQNQFRFIFSVHTMANFCNLPKSLYLLVQLIKYKVKNKPPTICLKIFRQHYFNGNGSFKFIFFNKIWSATLYISSLECIRDSHWSW